jgi:hypothetical protein
MKSIIVIIEELQSKNIAKEYSKVISSFKDWDWATIKCASLNANSAGSQYFHLVEIPFYGKLDHNDLEISRIGGEITISNGNVEEDVCAYVRLKKDNYEERFHESVAPDEVPSLKIDSITICGTEIDNLKISEELSKKLKAEAENYKFEKEENLY